MCWQHLETVSRMREIGLAVIARDCARLREIERRRAARGCPAACVGARVWRTKPGVALSSAKPAMILQPQPSVRPSLCGSFNEILSFAPLGRTARAARGPARAGGVVDVVTPPTIRADPGFSSENHVAHVF
eukprot:2066977-Prymnesium_polylepis.1